MCRSGGETAWWGPSWGRQEKGLDLTLPRGALLGDTGTVLGSWAVSANGRPGIPVLLSSTKVPSKSDGCQAAFQPARFVCAAAIPEATTAAKIYMYVSTAFTSKSGGETGAGDFQTWRHTQLFRGNPAGVAPGFSS